MKKCIPRRRVFIAAVVIVAAVAGVALFLFLRRPGSGPDYLIAMHTPGVDHQQFARDLAGVLGTPPSQGNRITALHNGDAFFPAMLDAIGSAQHSVTLEMYIYWSGDVAQSFASALNERARAGIPVHVVIDAIGARDMGQQIIDSMREAGVELRFFNPVRFDSDESIEEMNYRTHRKLLIVDGRIGFTGGACIADEWKGEARNPDEWRDSQFRIEGPIVAELQAIFLDNWVESASAVLTGEKYFPAIDAADGATAFAVGSEPEGESGRLQMMHLLAIAAAESSIDIATSYFVPDEATVQHLLAARQRGVSVTVLMPGSHTDIPVIRHASRRLWGDLLEAGVAIYEYQPTMYHCKFMIVDDHFVSIGSANFDNRSFKLNDESNVAVIDAEFARLLSEQFDLDLAASRKIELLEWQTRPWHEKLRDELATILAEHL